MNTLSEIGIMGMGVMGKSLAVNLAGKAVKASVYNRHVAGTEEGMAQKVKDENPQLQLQPFDDLLPFIASLQKPRKILLMIPAGAIDSQVQELVPLLDAEDILIDGGNSFYADTERRIKQLKQNDIRFLGVGISGGEAGALSGPAIMPSGPEDAYLQVKKYFDLMAAKDKDGQPCCSYIGPGGAGHFVKMVHNGIEYAEMQIIAEMYHLLRFGLNKKAEEINDIFSRWTAGGSGSFLLDVTMKVLSKKENGSLLLDQILDQAEQKGTGSWSAVTALQWGVPYSSLTEAVTARFISARKQQRTALAGIHHRAPHAGMNVTEDVLKSCYDGVRLINHETGMDLIRMASAEKNWNINLSEVARIWTNGCIIKSPLMERIAAEPVNETSLLVIPSFYKELLYGYRSMATVAAAALQNGIAVPVLSSALNYYLGMTTAQSSANLIQAMRDYFGAHTYQRVDQPGKYFHTKWE